MVGTKCVKCGADIPEGAGFCPACGAPKAAEQQSYQPFQGQQQPQQQRPVAPPVQQQPVRRKSNTDFNEIISKLFSKMMVTLALFIGILTVWIIDIVSQFFTHVALRIVSITFSVGIGAVLLFAGLLNKNIDKYSRLGMIIAGGIFLAWNL